MSCKWGHPVTTKTNGTIRHIRRMTKILRSSPMVVGIITNNHFPARSGRSLQIDPVKRKEVRYTPNEGVRSPDRAALNGRSDCTVNNGGTASD
eukprot:6176844-Pleurochrysis_carterae.AAC.3